MRGERVMTARFGGEGEQERSVLDFGYLVMLVAALPFLLPHPSSRALSSTAGEERSQGWEEAASNVVISSIFCWTSYCH